MLPPYGFFVLVLVAGLAWGGWSALRATSTEDPTHADVPSVATPPNEGTEVCGGDALDGPATPPEGALVVSPRDDLAVVTAQAPAGATFWLQPGRHVLADGEFSQVLPKSGDRYVGAPGAVLDGRRTNRYAFGGPAERVSIEYLTIRGFGAAATNADEGVVNHDAGPGWRMSHLTVEDNAGAGVFLGDENVVEYSCLAANGQYGFSAYAPNGVHGVTVRGNEITGNNTDDWETRRPGCGCTGGGKFWATVDGVVADNYIHGNHGPGVWADTNNAGFTFSGNYFADNDGPAIMYETSYNAAITGNTFIRNGLVSGPGNPGFPTGAVYISESGSDPRVDTKHSTTFEIAENLFVDNWGGVVAWENADRFAGSPANTSTGASTLVNPEVTVATCSNPDLVKTEPDIDDCRWKTQNLRVHDNTFRFSPKEIGADCTIAKNCGFSALMSNYGTFPDWSPYQGTVVEESVTFRQNNVWSHNTYVGPWRFVGREQGNQLTWDEWRSPPFDQDASSTLTP